MLADFAGPRGIVLNKKKRGERTLYDLGTITFCIRKAKNPSPVPGMGS